MPTIGYQPYKSESRLPNTGSVNTRNAPGPADDMADNMANKMANKMAPEMSGDENPRAAFPVASSATTANLLRTSHTKGFERLTTIPSGLPSSSTTAFTSSLPSSSLTVSQLPTDLRPPVPKQGSKISRLGGRIMRKVSNLSLLKKASDSKGNFDRIAFEKGVKTRVPGDPFLRPIPLSETQNLQHVASMKIKDNIATNFDYRPKTRNLTRDHIVAMDFAVRPKQATITDQAVPAHHQAVPADQIVARDRMDDPFTDHQWARREPTPFEHLLQAETRPSNSMDSAIMTPSADNPFMTTGILHGPVDSPLTSPPFASSTPRYKMAKIVRRNSVESPTRKSHSPLVNSPLISITPAPVQSPLGNMTPFDDEEDEPISPLMSADVVQLQKAKAMRSAVPVVSLDRKKHPSPGRDALAELQKELRNTFGSVPAAFVDGHIAETTPHEPPARDSASALPTSRPSMLPVPNRRQSAHNDTDELAPGPSTASAARGSTDKGPKGQTRRLPRPMTRARQVTVRPAPRGYSTTSRKKAGPSAKSKAKQAEEDEDEYEDEEDEEEDAEGI